jgi:DNA-binding XRE family transcriptional regulator
MRGYSQGTIELNQKAKETTGTLLGAICIALKYPASQVAKELHVSRQTVYDWFSGKARPSRRLDIKIKELATKLQHK